MLILHHLSRFGIRSLFIRAKFRERNKMKLSETTTRHATIDPFPYTREQYHECEKAV